VIVPSLVVVLLHYEAGTLRKDELILAKGTSYFPPTSYLDRCNHLSLLLRDNSNTATMHFIALLILFTTAVFGQLNTTNREFALRTVVKPNQPGKERFADLYLTGYHTDAGLNDAVFVSDPTTPVKGFLNGTVGKSYHKMVVDLGSDFPYFLNMQINTNFYAAWEPVAVNVGGTNEGVPEAFWGELIHMLVF